MLSPWCRMSLWYGSTINWTNQHRHWSQSHTVPTPISIHTTTFAGSGRYQSNWVRSHRRYWQMSIDIKSERMSSRACMGNDNGHYRIYTMNNRQQCGMMNVRKKYQHVVPRTDTTTIIVVQPRAYLIIRAQQGRKDKPPEHLRVIHSKNKQRAREWVVVDRSQAWILPIYIYTNTTYRW